MKKVLTSIIVCLLAIAALAQNTAEKDVLKTGAGTATVAVSLDGRAMQGGWSVLYGNEIDPLDTKAGDIVFASDIDTLRLTLDVWQSKEFTIVSESGDKAPVRVTRVSDNIYEHPDPGLLKRAPGGLLSREQAEFDINALVYGLSEVHPDMFSVCRQADFFKAVNMAIKSLPDSVSTMELYGKVAPIVAMIGDGHTNISFPYKDVFTSGLKLMPLDVEVRSDKSIICLSSPDRAIPQGARILSINGINADNMLNSMQPYVAGEKEPFRLARINVSFSALHHMLYPADSFDIEYQTGDKTAPRHITLKATAYKDRKQAQKGSSGSDKNKPYAYTIDEKKNVAIMDFRTFIDIEGMKAFADSMFRELRDRKIGNLIIDIRHNSGGNSVVGDVLLRYISPEPFVQMDKALVRITPFTCKLMGAEDTQPVFTFFEASENEYILPHNTEEGHYDGNVYLLTSSNTFSSAGSFAWTFKECGVGKVIGEETGGMNVHYGDVLSYRLPVSGLHCTISYKRFWQFHADENDIHGTIPDIAVPAADALARALREIKVGSSLNNNL